MRLAVTGTPGTGKTAATARLETALEVIHLNEEIRDRGFTVGVDEDRGTLIADLTAVTTWLEGRDDVVIESHLAHRLDVDRVVVLRCHPDTLEARLLDRGESPATAAENAEAEALDLVLWGAIERHGEEAIYEIDTTDRDVAETARAIGAVIDGDRDPAVGIVSFLEAG